MEIHQIDTTKIGDMTYVKEIVRAMLAKHKRQKMRELVKRDTLIHSVQLNSMT